MTYVLFVFLSGEFSSLFFYLEVCFVFTLLNSRSLVSVKCNILLFFDFFFSLFFFAFKEEKFVFWFLHKVSLFIILLLLLIPCRFVKLRVWSPVHVTSLSRPCWSWPPLLRPCRDLILTMLVCLLFCVEIPIQSLTMTPYACFVFNLIYCDQCHEWSSMLHSLKQWRRIPMIWCAFHTFCPFYFDLKASKRTWHWGWTWVITWPPMGKAWKRFSTFHKSIFPDGVDISAKGQIIIRHQGMRRLARIMVWFCTG